MLRLLADENFNGDIVRGLLLREPGFDIVRMQDLAIAGSPDPDVLAWAQENDRITLTHDRRTMPMHARTRLLAGERMAGLFTVSDRLPVGEAIRELLLINECSEQREWPGLIAYLPL